MGGDGQSLQCLYLAAPRYKIQGIKFTTEIGISGNDAPFWGVTVEIALRFQQPVPLEIELTARGRITKENRRLFEGTGELYLPNGTVAVRATGKYVKMALDGIADVDTQALGWQVYED